MQQRQRSHQVRPVLRPPRRRPVARYAFRDIRLPPPLGGLRIQEVTPGAISRALKAIAERSGPRASKSARACLSGIFGLAIEDEGAKLDPNYLDAISC